VIEKWREEEKREAMKRNVRSASVLKKTCAISNVNHIMSRREKETNSGNKYDYDKQRSV